MNGVLEWFARNRVAANLLMLMIALAGLLAVANGVRREVFPIVSLDMISVRVPYPGATPQEVEDGILLPAEEAIADLDGIDELNATAAEGAGTLIVKVRTDANARELMNDVKSRIDGVTTFPKDAEEPIIEELTLRMLVITVALSSETADEPTLRLLAEEVREELLALPGITQVKLGGVRPYEIGIHVSENDLRRHGITFDDVAQAVRASSLNLPAGSIRAHSGDIRIRTESQAYRQKEFENLVLLTAADGTRVRLKDVADVVDGFEEDERWARFDNRAAVTLSVQATTQENAPDVASTVHSFIEARRASLPAGVHLDTWMDVSKIYSDRENLMIRNGLSGLVLVCICLGMFLDLRLAFWVALGLALSFIGTFVVLWFGGVSINMISMAAFILVLGILVDDGIVVSESVHQKQSEGLRGEEGSVAGVKAVATPVIFSVLTTVIAFLPMFGISGVEGKIWGIIPMVIVSCLLLSLFESLIILPAHLSHEKTPWYLFPFWPLFWAFEQIQKIVDRLLQAFIRRVYQPLLDLAIRWRYMTVAVFVGMLILTVGLLAGGRVKVAFFPRMPGDIVVATLELPHGTPADTTRKILQRIEKAAVQLREEVDGGGSQTKVFKHLFVAMGSQPMKTARDPGALDIGTGGPHLAEAAIEFENLQDRGLSSETLADRWRDLVGIVPGVRQLVFEANEGEHAKDIHIRLTSKNLDDIGVAVDELKRELHGFAGVYEIADTLGSRQNEITLEMLPGSEPLGLRVQDLARQVRQAFYGEEAQRIQRGRDDIRVMVRYPEDQRRSIADLQNMRIRTPAGDEVPLGEVARINFGQGLASIGRCDRKRIADVTALLNRDIVSNPEEIMAALEAGPLASLPKRFPGLTWSRGGGMEDQQRVIRELAIGFAIALFGMYALMAIAFKSYLQPVIIAIAIPFGFVGAVGGHILLGETFSIISFLGLVALAGVVVNDSIVLVDAVNRNVREGMKTGQAVRLSCRSRFRPILLTSVTTFLGLMPLISETSFQAKFIIPMAVALAFGVAFATCITLSLVPAVYMIVEDFLALVGLSDGTGNEDQAAKGRKSADEPSVEYAA
ncbi:MAG: efflux RND transporter permease subunit [Planctomycetaceae bacterium]|nr:efflux RND transporter permease subunit [Planctomycetaceae bacterium]